MTPPPAISHHFAPDPAVLAPITVLIAAGHDRARAALEGLVESEPTLEHVASATNLASSIRALRGSRPELAVIDQAVLGHGGLDRLPLLAAVAPMTAFFVLGVETHPDFATRARRAGAAGYILLEEAAERLAPAAREAVLRPAWTASARRGGAAPESAP
jgi:two-component system, NarL family, response regulator DesR